MNMKQHQASANVQAKRTDFGCA